MLPLADPQFANTIAGALAPAISLVAVAGVGIILRRLKGHKVEPIDVDGLVEKITEDNRQVIANGITTRLNSLTHGQAKIERRLTRVERKIDG